MGESKKIFKKFKSMVRPRLWLRLRLRLWLRLWLMVPADRETPDRGAIRCLLKGSINN